jgi:iron complex transport system ATP-binding protein
LKTADALNMPAVETHNLSLAYPLRGGHRRTVYSGLDLQAPRGGLTCLLGVNGAGKSTLLRTLCGFLPPADGAVQLFGKAIGRYTQEELSRTAGVVLTEKIDAGGLTVYDLVSLGRHPHTGFFGRLGKADRRIIDAALHAVSIAHKSAARLSDLSDGERQRAVIAKALAQECPLIVLDEPTAYLDVPARIDTFALLRRLCDEAGKTILLSTHDLDLALRSATHLWLLHPDGRRPASGDPSALLRSGAFADFFRPDVQADLLARYSIESVSPSDLATITATQVSP